MQGQEKSNSRHQQLCKLNASYTLMEIHSILVPEMAKTSQNSQPKQRSGSSLGGMLFLKVRMQQVGDGEEGTVVVHSDVEMLRLVVLM